MRTFKVELDTAYADKAIKETGLLQGNQNFAFDAPEQEVEAGNSISEMIYS